MLKSFAVRNQKHACWQCLLMFFNILKWVPAATLPAGNNKISIQVQLSRMSSSQDTILKIIEPRITLAPRTMLTVTKQGEYILASHISLIWDITPGSATLQRGRECLGNCCSSVLGFLFWFVVLSIFHLQHFEAGSWPFPTWFWSSTSRYPWHSQNVGARTAHFACICIVFCNQGPFRIGFRWF